MTVEEYIKETIDNHEKEFGLYFSDTAREVIQEAIIKGIYAFNIIYDIQLKVNEIRYLNYKLCIHYNLDTWFKDKMWSYDGGQRYQWSGMETLIFDPSIIRNIKLEEVLK
jgi:hypothetical protein